MYRFARTFAVFLLIGIGSGIVFAPPAYAQQMPLCHRNDDKASFSLVFGQCSADARGVGEAVAATPVRATVWRLPAVDELMSIAPRRNVDDGLPVVDALAFPDTP